MLGRRLGKIGVDEAARAPLEAGDLREARNDLDMPVIVVGRWHVKRLRVEMVVVCGLPGGAFDTTDNVTHNPREFAKLARLRIFKSRCVTLRGHPNLIRKAAGVRTKRH